jgi:hypothetical protein
LLRAIFGAIAVAALIIASFSQAYAFVPVTFSLVSGPEAKSFNGDIARYVIAGQQVVLETTLKNDKIEPLAEPVIFVLEMRDPDGFTVLLDWQSIKPDPGETDTIGFSWLVPNNVQVCDDFHMRIFVIASIRDPYPLTQIFDNHVKVGSVAC